MKKRILIALVLIAFVIAVIYACGGSGGGGGNVVTSVTLTNFQTASIVIGQPTFTTNSVNQGAGDTNPAANTLNQPYGNPLVQNGKLYVPDCRNNRILVFDSIPAANDASADFVLGQPDMFSWQPGSNANEMSCPKTVTSDNEKLFVADYDNHRVLIFSSTPTGTQPAADIVVGQPDFGSAVSSCTGTGLNFPEDIEVAAGKLIVADSYNNRVLIWNNIPASGEAANVVLGQDNFTTCDENNGNTEPSDKTLLYPSGLWSDGTRLIVADSGNHRVLIWNKMPTLDFTPADLVLGQVDFTHNTENEDLQTGNTGTASARTLYYPYSVDSNGRQLFVADENNNRVLVWNSMPTENFTPADVVLGQGDFEHITINDDDQNDAADNPSDRTLNDPRGIHVNGTRLFVTDGNNNRVLIYESR